jgi:hypothetical protein
MEASSKLNALAIVARATWNEWVEERPEQRRLTRLYADRPLNPKVGSVLAPLACAHSASDNRRLAHARLGFAYRQPLAAILNAKSLDVAARPGLRPSGANIYGIILYVYPYYLNTKERI